MPVLDLLLGREELIKALRKNATETATSLSQGWPALASKLDDVTVHQWRFLMWEFASSHRPSIALPFGKREKDYESGAKELIFKVNVADYAMQDEWCSSLPWARITNGNAVDRDVINDIGVSANRIIPATAHRYYVAVSSLATSSPFVAASNTQDEDTVAGAPSSSPLLDAATSHKLLTGAVFEKLGLLLNGEGKHFYPKQCFHCAKRGLACLRGRTSKGKASAACNPCRNVPRPCGADVRDYDQGAATLAYRIKLVRENSDRTGPSE